jgi:hypothetical protein
MCKLTRQDGLEGLVKKLLEYSEQTDNPNKRALSTFDADFSIPRINKKITQKTPKIKFFHCIFYYFQDTIIKRL